MINDFYLSIIPLGKVDWHNALNNIAFTTILNDNAYKCWRYFESLESKKEMKIDCLPVFFPNEAIHLKDNIKLRIVVNYPILKNDKDYVFTPWKDDEIPYNEACWFSAEKIIGKHSEYVVILKDTYLTEEDQANINNVVELCNKYNKPYKIATSGIDNFAFKNIYSWFND